MFWIYISLFLALIATAYIIWDRRRLMLFQRINSIAKDKTAMIRVDMSVKEVAKLTQSTISHTIDTGSAILFEYRTDIYMAIPLGGKASLISHVSDSSMMQKYRASRQKEAATRSGWGSH